MKTENSLTIAIVQTKLYWEDVKANKRKITRTLDTIAKKTDIIFLPEMFNSGFSMNVKKTSETMDGETVTWLKSEAKKRSICLVGSIAVLEKEKYFNRLLWVDKDGNINYYDKRHTFTMAGEDKVFSKGKKTQIIHFNGWKFFPQVCYDLRFPVWSRNIHDYDVVFYLANWPSARADAWDILLRARAIENVSYCLGVNIVGEDPKNNKYVGRSCVVDPEGKKISLGLNEKEGVIIVELKKEILKKARTKFKFLKDRDEFTFLNQNS